MIRKLKIQISKKYQLPESTIISIAELACHEPGCPPIETIITFRAEDGSMKKLESLSIKLRSQILIS